MFQQKQKVLRNLEDAPLKSSELHHCKWNQDQASLFGFIAAILFVISWLIICAINGHKLLLGNEGACVPGLCCVTQPGWCYTNTPVLWSSAAHLNVEEGFSAFPAPVLITRSESWLRLSWVLIFHKVGSKSLPCGETDTGRQILFRRNMSSLHTQNPWKSQEAESSSMLPLQQVSPAQYCSFLLLILSLWDQQI